MARLKRRLRASRQATRQIFAADDPQSLIKHTCRIFVETLGYAHAWIALLGDDERTVTATAVEGLGTRTQGMRERLENGVCDAFLQKAVDAERLLVMRESLQECASCPLASQYEDCAGLARGLRFGNRLYGVVSVSVSDAFAHDPQEQDFFREMAENTAYALYRLEQDQDLRLATGIVNTSPTVALVWENSPNRRVRFASRNAKRLLGYFAEDLIAGQKAFVDFVHPDDLERVLAETSRASRDPMATSVPHQPYRIIARSGEVKWIQDMTTIERAADGTVESYHGLLLDISERKEAEGRLQQSERFLDSVVNGIADPIFVKDEQHRWIALNDAFCQMFGRGWEEMIGKSDSDFFPPEQVKVFWEHDDKVLASDEVDVNEEEITSSEGLRTISTIKSAFTDPRTGKRVLVGTIRDITKRKEIEDALRESETALRNAQRIARLGTWSVDLKTRQVSLSEEIREFLQGSEAMKETLSFEEWEKMIHPEDLDRIKEMLDGARGGVEPYEMEYRVVRTDGATRIFHVQGEYVRDAEGTPIKAEGTAQDVTDRRREQDELRDSRNRFRSIFDQTFQFAGIIALDGSVMDVNQTALTFIDEPLNEVVGKPFWQTPWWSHDVEQQAWLKESISQASEGMDVQGEVTHVSALGDLHYFDFSLKPVTNGEGTPEYLIAESRDVTERRLAEEKTKQLLAQQVAINALYAALGDVQNPDGVARILHKHVLRMMRSEDLSIAVLDSTGERLRVAYRVEDGEVVDANLGSAMSVDEPALALLKTVVRTGLPVRMSDKPGGNDGQPERADRASGDPWKSRLLVPMKIDGSVMGVLEIRSNRVDAYRQQDEDLLAGLASVAAIAIEKSRLQAKSLADAAELRAAFRGTIEILARATERRDPYTAGHQLRVAVLSAEIARALAFSEEQIESVRIAAMVHDIGKLAIPAEILSRPSGLSAMEYKLVQSHVQSAYDILKTIDFPWPVADIVSQHHERLDGSGYPAGLRGDDIMIEAQIVAAADVVEAMSHHRPYRPSLGIEAALAEVESQRGRGFDRDVVDACLRLFETGFAFPEGIGG